ncbi:MAG TPA: SURF1 family protein [Longimicrobiales bacterium]
MSTLRITRAGIVGSLVVLVVAATCVRLGIWQLHRLDERRGRNARIAARMAAPALALERSSGDTAGLAFRRVTARGTWDDERTIVWAGRSLQGDPGVYVLTPLLLPGGGAVVVNRGWLPSPDAATVDLASYKVLGSVQLAGLLVPYPPPDETADTMRRRVRYHVDQAGVAASLPYPVEPVLLQLTPTADARQLPRPLPPPALDEGPHLSYAIQWFSFAVIGIVGWVVLLLRSPRADTERVPTQPG